MFRKIITYFLILAVVLPVFAAAVPLPSLSDKQAGDKQFWGAKISYASTGGGKTDEERKAKIEAQLEKQKQQSAEVNGICDIFWGKGTFIGCAMWLFIDGFLYKIVLKLSVLAASVAGAMFNISIGFSLTGATYDASKNLMIKDGWTYVRDLLNLVFIFILLFAAISTILQYGNFQIKKILPSLIVVALLVNFSLMISKMVIDVSHVFAWEFYNQIDVKKNGDKNVANIEDEIQVIKTHSNFEKKNLANVFIAGFNPQKMLTGDTNNPSAFAEAMKKAMNGEGELSVFSLMTQMMIIVVLQSVLALFAGFVLLAGAIMFVLRVVVLWLVMIFSPLAFLGMILPSMQKYSSMWWGSLIGQSFFAPAFLFMFMLVTKFISGHFVDSIVQATENSNLKIAFGLNAAVIVVPFFHFMIVGGLMLACLIVARQVGGKTAQFGIGGAHRVKNMALSGSLRTLNNRGTRWLGGKVGDSNWWKQSIGRIPGGNILGRKLGAMKKVDEDKAKKAAEKYESGLSKAGSASLARDIGSLDAAGKESKSMIKRFLYTGTEGAWKPGREGYRKGIAQDEKIEKEKIELKMLNKAQPWLAEMAKDSKLDIKIIDGDLDNIETKLQELNYNLMEAVKNGTSVTTITNNINIEKAKKAIKINEKESHKENIENAKQNESRIESLKEREERRNEASGLQGAIKSSGGGTKGGTP